MTSPTASPALTAVLASVGSLSEAEMLEVFGAMCARQNWVGTIITPRDLRDRVEHADLRWDEEDNVLPLTPEQVAEHDRITEVVLDSRDWYKSIDEAMSDTAFAVIADAIWDAKHPS